MAWEAPFSSPPTEVMTFQHRFAGFDWLAEKDHALAEEIDRDRRWRTTAVVDLTKPLESRKVLLTDGPFVDSKEFLAGLILVEAENLDGALAVAAELQELDVTAAIEVRPVLEQELGGA